MMIPQRYKFYLAYLLFALTIISSVGCRSMRPAQTDTEAAIRSTIDRFIKAVNEEDLKTLKILYAEDFKSYSPVYNLPKKQLLESLEDGFKQQDHRIQAKITEITSGTLVATAHLQWIIMDKNQEIIFAQNLLQIWKKQQKDWKLSRILFYQPNEVLELEDFKF